jgi:hypothetical protein
MTKRNSSFKLSKQSKVFLASILDKQQYSHYKNMLIEAEIMASISTEKKVKEESSEETL